MRYFYSLILLLSVILVAPIQASDSLLLAIPFYNQNLSLLHNPATPTAAPLLVEENLLVQWYEENAEEWPYQLLLQSLQEQKKRLHLNDWLYFELIWETSKTIGTPDLLHQRLLSWFLLSKSGYDTRITFRESHIYIYAYTEEGIFDTPMIQDNSKKFVNLSSIHQKMENPTAPLSLLQYKPVPYGKEFSFDLKEWPALTPKTKALKLQFKWKEESFAFSLEIDETVAQFMANYPIIEEHRYFDIPLSPTLAASLLPSLREIIADKTQQEALEILVTFTRTVFAYREDRDHFGRNKPMIADELFHYPYSDCEDRSALFYNLVQELIGLPMIIIAYPNHLTIGVALSESIGPAIRYRGRSYYICDPTGPKGSEKIGNIPQGFEATSFEILGYFE